MKSEDLKVGDLFCDLHYYTVHELRKDMVIFKDSNGSEWGMPNKHVEEVLREAWSADKYKEEKVVGHTEVAQCLLDAGMRPFTVEYIKANGEDRVLRGTFVQSEPIMGRSIVRDMDVKEGGNLRQVDHRTIKSLILDGVKYNVK